MKLLCFERDNVTYASPTGNNGKGHAYSASFEFYPFHEGATYALYKGVFVGSGARSGQFCVVRSHLDTKSTDKDWEMFINRSAEARRLAVEFNRSIGHVAILFEEPMLTAVDSISDFSSLFRIFKPHDKRLEPRESVVVEPFLEGEFKKDNYPSVISQQTTKSNRRKQSGSSAKMAERGSKSALHQQQLHDVASAFSHFTWLHSNHKLLVSGIQGVYDPDHSVFRFCNPVIHSTDRAFGETDGASEGITNFLTAHRCSNTCTAFKCRTGLDLNIYQPQTCDKLIPVMS